MESQSSVPSMFIQAQPTYVKVEIPRTFIEISTVFGGMIPLLVAQPLQQVKHTVWHELLICQCPSDSWADTNWRETFHV